MSVLIGCSRTVIIGHSGIAISMHLTGSADRKLIEKFQNPKKRHLSNPKSGGDGGPEGSMVSLIENAFFIRFSTFYEIVTKPSDKMNFCHKCHKNAFEPVS